MLDNTAGMSDELLQKCAQAASFLQQEVVIEMFQAIEDRYVAAWKNAETTDQREMAWYRLQALYDVHTGFRILAERKEVWEEARKREERHASAFKLDIQKGGK